MNNFKYSINLFLKKPFFNIVIILEITLIIFMISMSINRITDSKKLFSMANDDYANITLVKFGTSSYYQIDPLKNMDDINKINDQYKEVIEDYNLTYSMSELNEYSTTISSTTTEEIRDENENVQYTSAKSDVPLITYDDDSLKFANYNELIDFKESEYVPVIVYYKNNQNLYNVNDVFTTKITGYDSIKNIDKTTEEIKFKVVKTIDMDLYSPLYIRVNSYGTTSVLSDFYTDFNNDTLFVSPTIEKAPKQYNDSGFVYIEDFDKLEDSSKEKLEFDLNKIVPTNSLKSGFEFNKFVTEENINREFALTLPFIIIAISSIISISWLNSRKQFKRFSIYKMCGASSRDVKFIYYGYLIIMFILSLVLSYGLLFYFDSTLVHNTIKTLYKPNVIIVFSIALTFFLLMVLVSIPTIRKFCNTSIIQTRKD